jgi:transposase InsO family protein
MMDENSRKKQEKIAIFRYGLIAPALHMGASEKRTYFKTLAGKEFDVPYYGMKKYGKGTFEDWLFCYRKAGVDGLKPAVRCDKGITRKVPEKIVEITNRIIQQYPSLSASGIYRLLIKQGDIQPGDFSEGTLREYIRKNNLRQADETKKDRKKFEKEFVNELWIADFMHGPYIREGNKKRKVYLCAIIDDHSRMIVGWGWYEKENSSALANTLKQAIAIYGMPQVLYCDNGKVFSTNYLQFVAATLGIALVHSQPYDSPSRGKIERFFRTVRDKFLAGIDVSKLTLVEFISSFAQWLDKEYHKVVNHGIGERPLDRYLSNLSKTKIKTISSHELDNSFLQYITRKVKNDATISIGGKLYEVPPKYIGKKVELSFPIDQPEKITLMDDRKPVIQVKEVNPVENANKPYTSIHFKDIKKEEEK